MRAFPVAIAVSCVFAISQAASSQGSPWTNLGGGKSGTFGTPILTASPLQAGKSMFVRLASARQRALAYFVFGFHRVDQPLLGGTLVPSQVAIVSRLTDQFGSTSFAVPVPSDRRLIGADVFIQCIVADPLATASAAFSNALSNSFCADARFNLEDFRTSTFLDADSSAGTWGNGQVEFSPIGGNGRHGVFDPTLGRLVNSDPKTYEWNTDRMTIPRTHTSNGKTIVVTSGRFFFSKFEVPANVVVRFVGSNPARIWVQGTVRIAGILQADGRDILPDAVKIQRDNLPQAGEPSGIPGCFGGAGGAGADRGDGTGRPNTAYRGKNGADIVLLGGHAYASRTARTGGRGSPQHPSSNDNKDIGFGYFNAAALEMNKGGGGGGNSSAGGRGSATWDPKSDPNKGSRFLAKGTTAGGVALIFPPQFPPYTNRFTRQDHYLLGGSGGGGGGSSSGGALKRLTTERYFRIGRAGTGGGGGIAFRIGNELVIGPHGRLSARGGDPARDDALFTVRGMMTPGGGGTGGSLFLQVNGLTRNSGEINVRGGRGGATIGNRGDTLFRGAASRGGEGADGMIHFEVNRNPNTYAVGNTTPAPRAVTGLVATEIDDVVGVRSLWYPADLAKPLQFLRYEIEAVVDGKPVVYSDDPLFGPMAFGPSSPVRFTVQGAELVRGSNGQLQIKSGTKPTIYLKFVGPFSTTEPTLNGSRANGYRFSLVLARSLKKTVDIKKIRVYWCL